MGLTTPYRKKIRLLGKFIRNLEHGFLPVEGSCEHDDEPSGSLKCWEVPE
jgi:hypothetical protein